MGIRVLLVDDHEIVRLSMTVLMGTLDSVTVVGEAENGHAAIELCGQLRPDVVLMDLIMPEMDGVAATKAIHELYPEIPVLILSSSVDSALIDAALEAGAVGYIPKDTSIEVIISAIYRVVR